MEGYKLDTVCYYYSINLYSIFRSTQHCICCGDLPVPDRNSRKIYGTREREASRKMKAVLE